MTFPRLKTGFLKASIGMVLSASVALLTQTGVMAAEGNSNYLGILSSTAPTGFVPSPSSYSLALNQNTLTFNLQVTNLTSETKSMNLQLNLDHITVYQGVNVANGQPGVVNGAVVDGQFNETLATEIQDPNPTITAFSIGPNATQTLQFTRTFAASPPQTSGGASRLNLSAQRQTDRSAPAFPGARVPRRSYPAPARSPGCSSRLRP